MSVGTRLAIAFVLGLIAAVGVPQPKQAAPAFVIDGVSDDMKTKVADVARALKAANPAERAIWASVWEKAAVVVAGDAVTTEVVFTDTRSLRGFTVLSLDIAWRRLGGVKAGQYPGLREAVEKAMVGVVGLDVKPVDADLRRAYGEACRAIAWAGYGNGG
jgi:hypothetical protein